MFRRTYPNPTPESWSPILAVLISVFVYAESAPFNFFIVSN